MVNPRFVIKAVISGQRLNINVPLTVSGAVNYIGVEAKCTSEWDGCTIVCYILQPSTGYYAQLGLIYDQERDLYYFPNAERLVLSAGQWNIWFVGIIAQSGQEKYRVTTETRVFTVYTNEFENRLPPGNITLDEQAIAKATDAQNKANLILDLYNQGKLVGPKGDPGDPAEIGFVQASVDNTTENPTCTVTVTENPENTYNMQFAFSGIKGAKGDTGATGPKGDTGAQGTPGRDGRDGEDGQTIDDYVLVQAEQPTSETNKMWLKPTASGDPIMIPSAEEFQGVNTDVANLKSATKENTDTISEMLSGIGITGENLASGTLTSGYYAGNGRIVASNKYSHLDVDITGCNYLYIDGTMDSTPISGWNTLGHFKNSSDVRIENIPLQTKQPYVLQVPTGAVKLCINTDYKASDYPSSLPPALEVYKMDASPNSVVKTVDLAKSGTNVKILTGIIRNSGNGWRFIDDGDHGPLNMASVELTEGGSIVVNYGFTAKKILSLVATPDETFARDYTIGGSVNLDKVTFNVYRLPYMIGGEVKYTASTGVWDISGSNFTGVSFDTTTKRLTLSHANLTGATSSPRNCCNVSGYNCDPRIRALTNTQIQVIFVNADGTTMDAPTTNMNFYITRFVPCLFANANNIVAANGNFWIMGVMEI